jgi:hypothetical protein
MHPSVVVSTMPTNAAVATTSAKTPASSAASFVTLVWIVAFLTVRVAQVAVPPTILAIRAPFFLLIEIACAATASVGIFHHDHRCARAVPLLRIKSPAT